MVEECYSLCDNCVNFNLLRLNVADFLGLLDKGGFARRSVVDVVPVEPVPRQHCRLTICMELVELTNSDQYQMTRSQ